MEDRYGVNSVSIGQDSYSQGNNSIAIGNTNNSFGERSIAIGESSKTLKHTSIAQDIFVNCMTKFNRNWS